MTPKPAWLCRTSYNTTYTFTMPAGNVSVTAEFFSPNVTITPDATYVDFDPTGENNAKDFREDIAAETAKITVSNAGIKGNGLVGNTDHQDWSGFNKAALVSIDVSDYIGRIHSATLKINAEAKDTTANSLRYVKTPTYVDFATAETISSETVKENGIAGTITTTGLTAIPGTIPASQEAVDLDADVTALLRSADDGKLTILMTTTASYQVYINDISIDLNVTEDTIPAAAATIHHVYKDNENGTISIDNTNDKYVEFGTNEEISNTAGYFVGDSLTPAESYKTAIDDTENKTSRYEYVSGVETVELGDTTNDVYVVYNKIDYVTTTFSVTLPEAAGEGGETVNVKLTGTPTSTGTPAAKAVDTNVAVTVAAGQTVGTATYKLLPGSYKYSYVEDEKYIGVNEEDVTVGDDGTNNTLSLTANEKTATKVTIKYVDADKQPEDDGYEIDVPDDVTTELTDQIYVGDAFALATAIPTYNADIKTNVSETTHTFKLYKFKEADKTTIDSLLENESEEDDNNVITLSFESDGNDYYYFSDFNGENAETEFSNLASWSDGKIYSHTQFGRKGTISYDTGAVLFTPATGDQNKDVASFAAFKTPYTTYTAANNYTIAFDWTVTVDSAQASQNHNFSECFEIANSEGNVLLAVDYKSKTSKYYTGGQFGLKAFDTANTKRENSEGKLGDNNATATTLESSLGDVVTYHVEVAVNQGTGKANITISKPGTETPLVNKEVDTDKGASAYGIYIHGYRRLAPCATQAFDNLKVIYNGTPAVDSGE